MSGAEEFPPPWLPAVPREARWGHCLFARWLAGALGACCLLVSLSLALAEHFEDGALGPTADFWMRLSLILGCCLVYYWLRSGLRVRLLLRQAEALPGEVASCRRLYGVNPNPLVLRYRYTDPRQGGLEGCQWIPLKSPLAQRLLAGERPELTVIADVDGSSRVVQEGDFLGPGAAG